MLPSFEEWYDYCLHSCVSGARWDVDSRPTFLSPLHVPNLVGHNLWQCWWQQICKCVLMLRTASGMLCGLPFLSSVACHGSILWRAAP